MGEQKKSVLKCFYYWAIQYLELSRIIKNFYTLTFNGIDYTRNSCLKISFLGTDKQSFWQKVMVMADDILLPKTPGSHSVRTLKKSVLSSYKISLGEFHHARYRNILGNPSLKRLSSVLFLFLATLKTN